MSVRNHAASPWHHLLCNWTCFSSWLPRDKPVASQNNPAPHSPAVLHLL